MKRGMEKIGREIAPEAAKRKWIDVTGQKFGRLIVLSMILKPDGTRVLCRCDCGKEITAYSSHVRKGSTRSCGCLKKGAPRIYSDEERVERRRAAHKARYSKDAAAAYHIKNREKIVKRVAEWKRANPEKVRASVNRRRIERGQELVELRRAYRVNNKEKVVKLTKDWCERNKEHVAKKRRVYAKHHKTLRRRLIGGQALAKFYAAETRRVYENCPPGHHVDHIVPLRGKLVCGLHIPINLQYLPFKDNAAKGNKFDPEQYDVEYSLKKAA